MSEQYDKNALMELLNDCSECDGWLILENCHLVKYWDADVINAIQVRDLKIYA